MTDAVLCVINSSFLPERPIRRNHYGGIKRRLTGARWKLWGCAILLASTRFDTRLRQRVARRENQRAGAVRHERRNFSNDAKLLPAR